jgi:putative phosphoribosyl transferase
VKERAVNLAIEGTSLNGDLALPEGAHGLVIFAHGSGSSRLSPRNRFVASMLQGAQLGTFLFDLLSKEEEAVDEVTGELRFDIGFLACRLLAATDWVQAQPELHNLALGLFGASTGAAAALVAAAQRPEIIKAVVSRGGRPDLAAANLSKVRAPTLLIVGGLDTTVIVLNEEALDRLSAEKKLVIIPGASHLFGEPGALPEVARLAAQWFGENLMPTGGEGHRLNNTAG